MVGTLRPRPGRRSALEMTPSVGGLFRAEPLVHGVKEQLFGFFTVHRLLLAGPGGPQFSAAFAAAGGASGIHRPRRELQDPLISS